MTGVLGGTVCPSATDSACVPNWTIDGKPLDLGPDPDLTVVQGDYNGDGTTGSAQDELTALVGHTVTVTLDSNALVVKINGLAYAQTTSEATGTWTHCDRAWCLDGQPVDLGSKPDLRQVQGDYDGNGTALPVRREFKHLIDQQVSLTVDLATGLVVQINGHGYSQPAS